MANAGSIGLPAFVFPRIWMAQFTAAVPLVLSPALQFAEKSVFSAQRSPSGWKPLFILQQLPHEWNSCPSRSCRNPEFFSCLFSRLGSAVGQADAVPDRTGRKINTGAADRAGQYFATPASFSRSQNALDLLNMVDIVPSHHADDMLDRFLATLGMLTELL